MQAQNGDKTDSVAAASEDPLAGKRQKMEPATVENAQPDNKENQATN